VPVGALDSTTAALDAPVKDVAARSTLDKVGWVALIALAPATLIYLSFEAGGYFPSATGYVAIVLAGALVLRTTLAERPFEGLGRRLAIPLGALVLYGAFALASAGWSQATAHSLDAYSRVLLYTMGFLLYGSVRYTKTRIAWLIKAVAGGLAVVCLVGLVSRVLPHTWPTATSFYANRLNYPLTYWNAEGMVAAFVMILGFHLSADRGEHPVVKVIAAAALPAVGATLLLTFSRGALGVTAIGLVAYCLLTRFSTLPSALIAAVPTTAIAMRSAWDATELATKHPTDALAVSQGHHVAVVVVACMLGAGALRAVLLPADRQVEAMRVVRTPPRLAVRAGIGAGACLAVVVVALAFGAEGFASKEYSKFVKGTHESHKLQTRDRLTDPANDGRLPLWRAALDIYKTQKLRGTGAGTYQQYYPRYRTEKSYVVDAHSLYLQSLAELGIVGFILMGIVVLGALGGLGSHIRGPDRAIGAVLFALVLAWAVHQGFDWDWQMPAVTLGVFMLAGLGLARRMDGKAGFSGLPLGRTAVALGWLVLAVCPLLTATSYARVQRAAREMLSGECASAKEEALSSLSLSAKRPQAYAIVGICDLKLGYAQAAVAAMENAVSLERQSWEEWFWLAVARAAAGQDPHAAIDRAIALNPLEGGLRHAARILGGHDPRAWERAAPRLRLEALSSGKFAITNL
jgi:hypothetical protein